MFHSLTERARTRDRRRCRLTGAVWLADARGEGLAGSFLVRQRELNAPRRLGTLGSRERAHSTPRISPERDIRPSKM